MNDSRVQVPDQQPTMVNPQHAQNAGLQNNPGQPQQTQPNPSPTQAMFAGNPQQTQPNQQAYTQAPALENQQQFASAQPQQPIQNQYQAPGPQQQPLQAGVPPENVLPTDLAPQPEFEILKWQAPSRPFKKRNRQFYVTVATITFLISLILFFAGQFLPVAVVISVAFLAYVLYSIPPDTVTNTVTSYGIRTENKLFYWEEMGRFWFDRQTGQDVMNVEVVQFPGRIALLCTNEMQPNQLREIMSQVLLEQRPADTPFEKASKWLEDRLPLETP